MDLLDSNWARANIDTIFRSEKTLQLALCFPNSCHWFNQYLVSASLLRGKTLHREGDCPIVLFVRRCMTLEKVDLTPVLEWIDSDAHVSVYASQLKDALRALVIANLRVYSTLETSHVSNLLLTDDLARFGLAIDNGNVHFTRETAERVDIVDRTRPLIARSRHLEQLIKA